VVKRRYRVLWLGKAALQGGVTWQSDGTEWCGLVKRRYSLVWLGKATLWSGVTLVKRR